MERGRTASPDVVQVSAGATTELAQKGNSETNLDTRTVEIMTYNVWFREDVELSRRMHALGDLIQRHSQDLICLQVTPEIYLLLQESDWWEEYQCSLSLEMAMQRSYYCMQMSKLPVRSFGRIPFSNTGMGRELCTAEVSIGGVTMVLATWDQMNSNERVAQAMTALRILGRGRPRNVVFCGDMNWDDGMDWPFPLPAGWVDAWPDMDGIEMIGKKALPDVSYVKVKTRRGVARQLSLPVLPSDHFGLVLRLAARRQAGSASSE